MMASEREEPFWSVSVSALTLKTLSLALVIKMWVRKTPEFSVNVSYFLEVTMPEN